MKIDANRQSQAESRSHLSIFTPAVNLNRVLTVLTMPAILAVSATASAVAEESDTPFSILTEEQAVSEQVFALPKPLPSLMQRYTPLHEALRLRPEVLEVIDPAKPVVDNIPEHVLNENKRFVTLNVENDFFGNGTDKDYTNGIRFTFVNMGAEQPFFVDWIDRLSPTFEVNKTTTSYFSIGQNLYTPQDITVSEHNPNDRPYAAFSYLSGGLSTATGNHVDNAELTVGWVGPSAQGKWVQTEYHALINTDTPMGWQHQIGDEPGVILSLERQWPLYFALRTSDSRSLRVVPHIGGSLGNIYTYANAGFTLVLKPDDDSWQEQPPRVRPAIPGSGFFLSGQKNWSWMAYLGVDTRFVARNIFLDGNTKKDSHSVDKRYWVFDVTAGVATNYKAFRIGYSLNWRSKEFNSPLAKDQVFGAVSVSYSY